MKDEAIRTKDEIEAAETGWDRMNERCPWCSQPIPYDERDVYYDTGKCGSCAHTLNKDD